MNHTIVKLAVLLGLMISSVLFSSCAPSNKMTEKMLSSKIVRKFWVCDMQTSGEYFCRIPDDSFHKKIMELESKVKFLIDGHSMKSVAPSMKVDAGKERPDITLGNRDYTTCSREITMKIKHFFEEKKFQVRINDPYKGKYILDHHCSRKGLSGIQIEINRKFYMDEKKLLVHEEKVKKLNCMIRELVEMLVEDVFKL